jgi:Sulfotransferase family
MPEPLFILSAPRNFSSVSGAMLGQHPQAYGLPELNLFLGDTLGEAWNGLANLFPRGHDGLLRTLAELTEGGQSDDTIVSARKWVMKHTHWSVKKVIARIQETVGDRMLVEKGPSLTFSPKFLERMYDNYPHANFLHLVRHPRTTGRSLNELHDNYNEGGLRNLMDPEQVWLRCHSNATNFGATLPAGQYMRIKGEDLMSDPYLYLPQVAQWLGLDDGKEAIEAMLRPEESPYAMLGPDSAPYGNDPNFLKNPKLDWDRLKKISESELTSEIGWRPGEYFSKPVVKLAKQFGYQ